MARSKSKRSKRATRIKSEQSDFFSNLGGLAAKGTTGSTKTWYINAAHCLSMMNRKAYHQVDSQGHVKYYGLQISVFNMVNGSTSLITAPLGYPMENAVRAWHFARKERYSEAGYKLSDLGYGSRLRFGLDAVQLDLNQSSADPAISPTVLAPMYQNIESRGEWDWSDVIITPPSVVPTDASHITRPDDLIDSFKLHLCGDHTEEGDATTLKYSKVGMIQSYIENTRGWAIPEDTDVIQPENPLAFARMSESSSMAITEEVSDEQKQNPPYSNDDDEDAQTVFAWTRVAGNLETAFPSVTTNNTMVVAPGGVMKIDITNNDDEAAYPQIRVNIVEL